jgi:hypothetical protein
MDQKNVNSTLSIRYSLAGNAHSMDAFVRNRVEKEFLEAVRCVSETLGIKIQVKTRAYEKGSLIENIEFYLWLGGALAGVGISTLRYLAPAINEIIVKIFTSRTQKGKLDLEKQKQELRRLELDNKEKALELEERIHKVEEDSKIRKNASNYYKQLKNTLEVESVEFCSGNDTCKIPRSGFDAFIIKDNTVVDIDDDAEIEIISPVLKDGTYDWKGVYRDKRIQFSMGDSKFKEDVIAGVYSFSNGFSIKSQLSISSNYDSEGFLKNQTFSVKKVYSVKEAEKKNFEDRALGIKRKRKRQREEVEQRQGMLFNEEDFN